MNATIAQLTARSLLGRRRAVLLALLPAILLALCAAARLIAGPDPAMTAGLLGGFALGTLVPLLALIAGTGAIGPEIDDGAILYLLSKPLRRSTVVLSKLVVAIGVVLVAAALPTLLAGLLLAAAVDVTVGYAVGAAVAGVTYCALFLLLGVVTRNAVVFGLAYALIWESLIGGFVPGAQVLSVQQWALAVTERVVGSGAADVGIASAVSLGTAIPLLLAMLVGSTWLATSRLRSLRLTGEQ